MRINNMVANRRDNKCCCCQTVCFEHGLLFICMIHPAYETQSWQLS
ncbi:MAG: hypothetical protein K2K21_14350 [Lachnospiraceae bacterium]|nr:hypothetical protein [Lachnospiraceae bacterium]